MRLRQIYLCGVHAGTLEDVPSYSDARAQLCRCQGESPSPLSFRHLEEALALQRD